MGYARKPPRHSARSFHFSSPTPRRRWCRAMRTQASSRSQSPAKHSKYDLIKGPILLYIPFITQPPMFPIPVSYFNSLFHSLHSPASITSNTFCLNLFINPSQIHHPIRWTLPLHPRREACCSASLPHSSRTPRRSQPLQFHLLETSA